MNRTARRFAAALACAAVSTLAASAAHAQSTAEANVAASASTGSGSSSGGGFGQFMDDYVWGRNVMALGWFYIRPMDSATPLTTTTSALGLGTYQSPGTDVRVSNANTLSLTFTHFFNDNIAGTFVGGVPPKFDLYGSGNVIAPVPVIGPLTLINLGLPQNNPVATVREWSPAIVAQYYFGTKESKFRPFVGGGVSYNFFTNLKLNPNFVNALQNLGQVLQLGMGQVPSGTAKVTAETSSSWTPVANVGVSYEFAKNWTAIGTVSYLPLKTTSTITIRSAQGQVLAVNKTDIKVDPLVFGLAIGYKF
ncbi:OmpW family protein [Ralstonia insidiosa]|jgi:outer membrane protein|nr:OmpW family outer membrane protein [Ralstonia insidiosa]KMW46511.1 membrane protein [Ralstonia sp. MD27]MBX3771782.1 OmpW family protein [Ralstonia pickettii]NOZ16716.1 OmpW family protein [Betaproteobacteria bacterium]MBA9855881.1 OmpW family protein [Ralstonia insidiosa]MBA9868824.1 OmpW family protein [Ralstonia insidiosa]